MYHVSLAVRGICGWSDEGGEDGDGNEEREISGGWERVGDWLVSCMQMTWFYVVSQRRT